MNDLEIRQMIQVNLFSLCFHYASVCVRDSKRESSVLIENDRFEVKAEVFTDHFRLSTAEIKFGLGRTLSVSSGVSYYS